MTEITSSMNSRVRLWKINHSGPGCSFYEFLRVAYFPVKHSCLYNNEDYLHPRFYVALPIQTDSIYDNLRMKPMNVCIKPKLPLACYLP